MAGGSGNPKAKTKRVRKAPARLLPRPPIRTGAASLDPALDSALSSASAHIWLARARANKVGLTRLEESDTELLELVITEAIKYRGVRAAFRKLKPGEESKEGADLEIWVGLGHGLFMGFSIQAKRTELRPRGGLRAESILHPVGSKKSGALQYDVLVSNASRVRSNPVHLLYSGWAEPREGDPLVSGPWPAAETGAAVLPTWWFREHLAWIKQLGRHHGPRPPGMLRVDPLQGMTVPLSCLFRPSALREWDVSMLSAAALQHHHAWRQDVLARSPGLGKYWGATALAPFGSKHAASVSRDMWLAACVEAPAAWDGGDADSLTWANRFLVEPRWSEFGALGLRLGSFAYGAPGTPHYFGLTFVLRTEVRDLWDEMMATNGHPSSPMSPDARAYDGTARLEREEYGPVPPPKLLCVIDLSTPRAEPRAPARDD